MHPSQKRKKFSLIFSVTPLSLTGCSISTQAPEFLILNSYFPSWLVGATAAFVVTVIFRALLIKAGIDDFLPARFFVYVAFWLIMTIAFSYIYSPR